MVKMFAAKTLVAKILQQRSSWQKYLLTDSFTPDACRSAWESCPPRLCASAHIFPLPRMSGRIVFNSSSRKLFQGPMMTHLPLFQHWPGTDSTQLSSPTTLGILGERGPHFFPALNNKEMYIPPLAVMNQESYTITKTAHFWFKLPSLPLSTKFRPWLPWAVYWLCLLSLCAWLCAKIWGNSK